MTCTRCGSDRLYKFEASSDVKVRPGLPSVCQECGQISIAGEPIEMPEKLENQAVSMARMAIEAGRDTRKKLEDFNQSGNDVRVEKYFSNVYQRGYLDGFFRCLAFYKHQAKEGRIKRMRELWNMGSLCGKVTAGGTQFVKRKMEIKAYTEFSKLLHICVVPEKKNAKNPSHKHQTNDKGTPSLS